MLPAPSLIIGNSTCRISGLTGPQFKAMRDAIAYEIPGRMIEVPILNAAGSRTYVKDAAGRPIKLATRKVKEAKRYSLLDANGSFPTGLLYLAHKYFKEAGIQAAIRDDRRPPAARINDLSAILEHTPYPEQTEAAEAARRHHRGIIVGPTGVGKSVIIALIIDAIRVPTLIVVPTLELRRQLIESLGRAFGSQKVGRLCDSRTIAVENIGALDPRKPLKGYDCVIIDEFHHSAAKTYRSLNRRAWTNVYYRFGLTATPFRSQDHERLLLESILSKVIYQIPYKTAVDMGYIVPLEAYYINLPKRSEVEGYEWAEVYKELVTGNAERNAEIQRLLINLTKAGASTLCLVKEVEHGRILSADGAFLFASGIGGDAKELIGHFNRGGSTLIGTTGVLGEGVDTRPCEYVIIAGLGRSKNAIMQQVGRGFRRYPGKESCKVILFRDASHKWTLNHYRAQVKVLKEEYGVAVVKL